MESTRLSRRFTTMSLLGASISILVIISVAGLSYGSTTTAFDGRPSRGPLSPHHKSVITFSGLDTNLRTCVLRGESVPIGEEVSQQFRSLGVVFASSQFALSEANRIEIVGGDSGLSGDPILAVDPTDGVNMCPLNGSENTNVTLTAVFVNPSTGAPATARNVAVHVSDGQLSVHIRTLNVMGDVVHDCFNVFSGCPYVVASSANPGLFCNVTCGVDLSFPGSGIARVQFIDEDSNHHADGFTIDDLSFQLSHW